MRARHRFLALVMAGGEGSRLSPLTSVRAKPVVPFAGTYRLVDFPMSNIAHSGLSDVWVVQQYEPFGLGEHLAGGRAWDLDRSRGGLRTLFPHTAAGAEGSFHSGNADAIWEHHDEIDDLDPEVLLVLSADAVYRLDYGEVLATLADAGADLTMVTTTVDAELATRLGVVEVADGGRVTGFASKPDEPASDVATIEVFAYDWPRLSELLHEIVEERGDEGLGDYGDVIVPRLVDSGTVVEHRHDGYWRDMGTLDSYWSGHRDLLEGVEGLDLDDRSWPILSAPPTRLPARVASSAAIEDSLICPGADVRGRVVRSLIGPGAVVAEGAEVVDSVLLGEVSVESGAVVCAAIVDAGAVLAARARVGAPWSGAERPGADDLAVVGQGARVAPGATVPPGGIVDPGA